MSVHRVTVPHLHVFHDSLQYYLKPWRKTTGHPVSPTVGLTQTVCSTCHDLTGRHKVFRCRSDAGPLVTKVLTNHVCLHLPKSRAEIIYRFKSERTFKPTLNENG